ncbi:hypothetical protein UA08_08012 [Talaromyces atroroseus]|uniref:Uncharacterized protein n=1 Tax=Talaromyces atroroseus TaxID=1441469 RepID=A0A225A9H5_TALAT|nr:hypothetical protein UA08_08012 [Talaromyces atroroseus]OKL56700.1 hypothetical protein UA08_08012 [Talaromyces atroroseus]
MSANGQFGDGMTDIIQALEVSHSPTSSNELRKEALQYLESKKQDSLAARNGFLLASNLDNSPLVRHFGLSLLDHVLLHTGFALSSAQILDLKEMVIQLAQRIREEDPNYYRNKVAQLWAEVAKRSWGIDWNAMDQDLFNLWNATALHKELVLTVLETLSEDIFFREDTVSSLRGSDLNRALVEVFTPLSVFRETYPEREQHRSEIRYQEDGWLSRICILLGDCIGSVNTSRQAKECTLKALAVLRTALVWSIPKAIISCNIVTTICHILNSQNEHILLAAIEALHSLYSRSNVDIEEFGPLVERIYNADHLSLLRRLYQWTAVDAADIDETRYQIAKKLSELMSYAATFLEEKDLELQGTQGIEISLLFEFLIEILRHQSLTVSIPVLHSWSRLLATERIEEMQAVTNLVAPLLEICTQRLVRWENLPEDSEDPTILFLNEDIDTIPERHAFVGNYRRYCSTVIEIIVQKRPHEAVPHILAGVDQNINNLYSGVQPFSVASFQKLSFPLMRADTQFSVVEATLKGYQKWIIAHGGSPQQDEQQRTALELTIENWAMSLMQRSFEDPVLKQRVIRLVVDISAKALDKTPSFALKVLEHILMTHLEEQRQYPAYSDAVRELHSLASHELRRLSMRYADYFFTFYDVLEPKIREIAAAHQLDDKLQTELISVLLIITQRTKNVDPHIREERLNSFMEPVRNAWQNADFRGMSASFTGFCELLGLEKVGPYMQSKQAANIEEWTSIPLDDLGKDIQEQMTKRFQQLPLRGTKTLLAVSTEKLKRTDPAYELGCALWRDVIPIILPTLLQLIGHAHAFHNPKNWNNLPDNMKDVVGRILTDRFWQAGISTGSRDDFYTKITTSKATLEGFASSVRGKVRAVRESCYSMLFSMSRLRQYFYGFAELPGPLSEALFSDSTHLSSHQFSVLLNISRCLIDDCPVQFRDHFLPPMISTLFTQIDKKVTQEWDIIEQRKTGLLEGDLTEEMKDESILRQLTYSAVIMVASLLDPQRGDPEAISSDELSAPQAPVSLANSMRHFVLSNPTILEPVFMFCTHALRMRDTRCGSIITRVIRSILVDFAPPVNTPTAITIREFISTEVLRACITSVHEPYFVDMQRDLATLIASIWVLYGPSTPAPRSVMLSLPGMTEQRVSYTETSLMSSTSGRQQRALVLDLLEGLRGVSISEQGKIIGTREERRKARSAMQQRYMSTAPADMEGQQKLKVDIDDGPDLGGIADMFG